MLDKINRICVSLSRHISSQLLSKNSYSKMNLTFEKQNINMQLYYDDISPPVRSVLMLIKELNLTDKVDMIFIDLFKGKHLTENYLQLSPMHTVPALIHGNITLTDSQAILIYMSEYYANDTLLALPKTNVQLRMEIINKLFFNGTILFDRDRAVFADIFGNSTNFNENVLEKHLEKFREVYGVMETFLQHTKYMAGNEITIADISILATLSTIAILLPVDEEKWPKLYKWLNNMKERKSYGCNSVGLWKLYDILLKQVDFKIYSP